MDRSDTDSPSVQRRRQVLWDWTALYALLVAAFTKFVVFRDYGLSHPEVWIVFGGFLILALAIALFIGLRREVLAPSVMGFLVVFFLFQEFGGIAQTAITDRFGMLVGEAVVFVLFAVPTLAVFWLLRRRVSQIVAAGFGALALASLFSPPLVAPMARMIVHDVRVPLDRDLPPLIHIVLDQQIGIDGLVDAIPGAAELRGETARLYTDAGFRVFSGAYTHFPGTIESLSNLLNGSVQPVAHRWIRPRSPGAAVVANAWFDRLAAEGYRVHVLQGHYLDYCGWRDGAVASCHTFYSKDVRVLHEIDVSPVDKARFLALYLLDIDYPPLSKALRLGWHLTQEVFLKAGIPLPHWDAHGISLSSVVALKSVASLEDRVRTLQRGEALFAHVYLPHHPYMLDAQCQVIPDTAEWHDRTATLWWLQVPSRADRWRARQEAYFRQSRCLNSRLAELFRQFDEREELKDATVIVHGDHGSLITITEPIIGNEDELAPIDIVSSYSTLFAIRSPGRSPGLESTMRSVQSLFAREMLGLHDVPSHDEIFLKPPRGVIGGEQTRLSMVPLTQEEEEGPPRPRAGIKFSTTRFR
jgi:hypothetical protein